MKALLSMAMMISMLATGSLASAETDVNYDDPNMARTNSFVSSAATGMTAAHDPAFNEDEPQQDANPNAALEATYTSGGSLAFANDLMGDEGLIRPFGTASTQKPSGSSSDTDKGSAAAKH